MTKKNRDSFDTLYSDAKIEQGGKGFGRFTCLKYFDDMIAENVFSDDKGQHKRSFRMGRQTDIIVRETITASPDGVQGSTVKLSKVKKNRFADKKLTTIARALVERLLPCFIDDILVAENTQFYGYVVCDISKKVELWLETEKDFTPMPDRRGWFTWIGNINLYVEVLSWDKVLRDAGMRNRVFFNTLGIE